MTLGMIGAAPIVSHGYGCQQLVTRENKIY